ncbi:MAG: hypothetical protein AAFZ92_03115 [Pseudomonadota bacterium]
MKQAHFPKLTFAVIAIFVALLTLHGAHAQASPAMTNQRLGELINNLDKNAQGRPGYWSLTVENVTVEVVTDERADRMRIVSPILKTQTLSKEALYRLMQANFDTVLDARYAIANGILWSTYIHPLGSLDDEQFLVGLGQTVNAVITYGSSYSSGLLSYQGGDSQSLLRRELIERLKKQGQAL